MSSVKMAVPVTRSSLASSVESLRNQNDAEEKRIQRGLVDLNHTICRAFMRGELFYFFLTLTRHTNFPFSIRSNEKLIVFAFFFFFLILK